MDADPGQSLIVQMKERRPQNGNQRNILMRIVQHLDKGVQVLASGLFDQFACGSDQGNAGFLKDLEKRFTVLFCRPNQNRHVMPGHRPPLTGFRVADKGAVGL